MSNELQAINGANVPAYLQADIKKEMALNEAAGSGILKSDFLPNLSIKGKCFSIRQNGDVKTFDMPALDVVIIAARPTISKVMYPGLYNPKENGAPVCASIDSESPDFPTQVVDPATGKCCQGCRSCYFNQFGSAKQGAGKACKDYKRLVVMLASPDGKNFPPNAPALILDVPATSLKSPKGTNLMMLKECVSALQAGGVPLSAYVVTLRFVMSSEYPQIVFQPKRWVLPEEMERIKALRESEAVKAALEEKMIGPKHEEEPAQEAVAPAPVAVESNPALAEGNAKLAEGNAKNVEATPTPATQGDLFQGMVAPAQVNAVQTETPPTEEEVDVMAQAEALLNQYKI